MSGKRFEELGVRDYVYVWLQSEVERLVSATPRGRLYRRLGTSSRKRITGAVVKLSGRDMEYEEIWLTTYPAPYAAFAVFHRVDNAG